MCVFRTAGCACPTATTIKGNKLLLLLWLMWRMWFAPVIHLICWLSFSLCVLEISFCARLGLVNTNANVLRPPSPSRTTTTTSNMHN